MIRIETLLGQHDEALAMAQRLLALVDNLEASRPIGPVVLQFNHLFGLLRVHLAHENVGLYAELMASPDLQVMRTAQRHLNETADLAARLECFALQWCNAARIAGRIEEFREEMNDLMLALAVRFEQEGRCLYPLAATVAATPRRNAA